MDEVTIVGVDLAKSVFMCTPQIQTVGPSSENGYHLAHAAEADMLRQLNRMTEALAAYRHALGVCRFEPERRVLLRRIAELEDK